jgi:gamma-D-glutamyl-L-lysine dipeptidyl-peptidase
MNETIDYGVCRLAVVPIRKEPNDLTEQMTQLLFGDHYEVTESSKDKKWFRIRVFGDQSEGWMDAKQHHAITKDYFDQINLVDFKITTEVTSWILYKKNPLSIVMGSIVPISASELFKIEEQFAFNGESKSSGQRRDFEFLKSVALRYLHAPFQWGGKSPFGIDASGFVQMVFKISGYSLFRNSQQQSQQGKSIKNVSEAKPGDLVFFHGKDNKINHSGILLDDAKIIHSFGRVRIDHLMEEGILNTESKIFTHSFNSIRRIF